MTSNLNQTIETSQKLEDIKRIIIDAQEDENAAAESISKDCRISIKEKINCLMAHVSTSIWVDFEYDNLLETLKSQLDLIYPMVERSVLKSKEILKKSKASIYEKALLDIKKLTATENDQMAPPKPNTCLVAQNDMTFIIALHTPVWKREFLHDGLMKRLNDFGFGNGFVIRDDALYHTADALKYQREDLIMIVEAYLLANK